MLKNDDINIRSEMNKQKMQLETKIENDIDYLDSALRNHIGNKVYALDNKINSEVNSKLNLIKINYDVMIYKLISKIIFYCVKNISDMNYCYLSNN
jgi:hypothetical protein